jgi:hypothetical protein
MLNKYDKIIIGAGLYGLYAALFCGMRGEKVLVLEREASPFKRATYINQARVHQGYHYPRSLSTALKSAHYFARFNRDFEFCINKEYKKVYATSSQFSWSDGNQFKKFCDAAKIPCQELNPKQFFKNGMCDGTFLTREYTYDATILQQYYESHIAELKNVKILFHAKIEKIVNQDDQYDIILDNLEVHSAPFVLNATYASTNQILEMLGFDKFKIKYELCEIILCNASDALKEYGFTVMDGPFFSIMPFGLTGDHSLTSVTFTPHATSYDFLPTFDCQANSGGFCTPYCLGNCNECPAKPKTAFPYMASLARKYLRDEFAFSYKSSLFSMKPILKSTELDDSRPTVVRIYSKDPTFVGVLSGKINTVYDLDEVLQ